MSNNILTIKEYFDNKTFAIPHYQRGYKWSAKEKDEDKSSVHFFCESIKNAYINNKKADYFIEAVTVVQENKTASIILVDGQQRTTTLYLIFIVLGDFDFLKDVILDYKIRKDSDEYLKYLLASEGKIESNTTVQDIFYFNEAIETIKDIFNEFLNDSGFKKFIKNNVKLLFNTIPASKAVNTFIALNGLKAIMKDEELIKSDILIQSSRPLFEICGTIDREEEFGFEWKINEDRGRLARNWDKWLYWWNQEEVRGYFGTGDRHPLYFLLVTYWKIESQYSKKSFDFRNFKNEFISNPKDAKNHFEGLRKLQKTFEDLYNNPKQYNELALSLRTKIEKEIVIYSFIKNFKDAIFLTKFTKWALLDCTPEEINKNDTIKFYERKEVIKNQLLLPDLFNSEGKAHAYLQLLRMNVSSMNLRKFSFEEFKTKSLEHICPQNPPEDNEEFIKSHYDIQTNSDGINSIGNLVLLNGSVNSSLSNHPLDRKKHLLFNRIKDGFLLPHTLKVFSKSFLTEKNESLFDTDKFWIADNVRKNKEYFINEFDKHYI